MLERLRDAMNDHDAQRVASLFAEDYQSTQPLHPARGFGGSAQVLENCVSPPIDPAGVSSEPYCVAPTPPRKYGRAVASGSPKW